MSFRQNLQTTASIPLQRDGTCHLQVISDRVAARPVDRYTANHLDSSHESNERYKEEKNQGGLFCLFCPRELYIPLLFDIWRTCSSDLPLDFTHGIDISLPDFLMIKVVLFFF